MKELGITKGEWVVEQYGGYYTLQNRIGYEGDDLLSSEGVGSFTAEHNAELCCDAGNTAQKCGLLPSELLQQRDELRDKYSQLLEYTSEFLKSMRTDNGELKKSIAEMSRDMASEAAAIKNTDG